MEPLENKEKHFITNNRPEISFLLLIHCLTLFVLYLRYAQRAYEAIDMKNVSEMSIMKRDIMVIDFQLKLHTRLVFYQSKKTIGN
jgi:hypothetical protein